MILEAKIVVEVDEDDFNVATFEWFLDSLLRKEDIVAELINAREIDALYA